MGSRSSKSSEKVVQTAPVIVEPRKFTYKKAMPSRPPTSASVDSTEEPEEPEEPQATPPPPVVTWEEILSQDQEEEEEPEREQYVAPRGTLPMGVGPYASLGKPRKRPETKVKKRKTPKPEATTIEELLLSDSEEEDEEEEEEGEDNKEQENSIRLNQTPVETPMTTLNDEVNEDDSADDDDSDIEFGSQFSGMNKPETGPDILFVKPDTNLPAKEIVGQGKHQYGRFPMSFSPVQSEVDLHAATIESEIRDTMEYLPSEDTTDTGLNAYFEAQMTKDQPQNKDDGESLLSDSEEEEDTSWMEDGRINKQMG